MSPKFQNTRWWRLPNMIANADISVGETKHVVRRRSSPSIDSHSNHDSQKISTRPFHSLCSSIPRLEKSQTIRVKETRHYDTKEWELTRTESSEACIATIVINTEFKEMKLVDNQSNDVLAKVVQLHGGGTRYKIYGTKPMFMGQKHYGTDHLYPWAEIKHCTKSTDDNPKFEMKLHRYKGKEIIFFARIRCSDDENKRLSLQMEDEDKNRVAITDSIGNNSDGIHDRSIVVAENTDPCMMTLFMAIVELFLETDGRTGSPTNVELYLNDKKKKRDQRHM
jgi:hypothetical protein